MDHIELKPYPFPEGMVIPRLMPFQEYPWNGDGYLGMEAIRLREEYGIGHAIETGACLGSTTCFLADYFNFVSSVEVNDVFRGIALKRLDEVTFNASTGIGHGKSEDLLPTMLMLLNDDESVLIFLDAHWNEHCPLLDELDAIASAGVQPCIIIHDFKVPGQDFGFDHMPDGRAFDMELIRTRIDAIYGAGKWKHNYPTVVEGARRGWISIEPNGNE